MQIALIGCGAIGTALLELVKDDVGLQIAAVVVPAEGAEAARAVAQRLAPGAQVVQAVPADGIDLVVEAAGHAAIEQHVLPALRRGVPCIVASVGALSAAGLPEQLEAAAREGRTQVQLIAGAIGGIDALAAARIGGLSTVRYTGRKPPHAWKGTPAEQGRDLDALANETVIFEGTAREAAAQFPKNANVAATVSLAGLGLDRTTVRLIADPAVRENLHQVEAAGAFGSFELTMRNQPLAANPKTSALTVFSAVRALRGKVAPLVI
ncbi:aspartate dehydrogenase [Comamonas odontotermitis]|uniref:L-aspartate dehydrogenase n=1 Tax=Comamonas odontotermitis TaxID=379895 RepID=A0ABR6RAE9_9BURK|nr:aspartate dehydrogenase [Comamonas odontotermitis]MBB6576120.1 aspartate dehydrogenase [Comamonas odontotermitis]